jgi:hypothetical protein
MVRLVLLLIATVVAVGSSASASPTLRSITIPEMPGSVPLQLCTDTELASFAPTITAESDDCAAKATYDWNSDLLPSGTERQELCKCTKLINKLQSTNVPRCGFIRSGEFYSYKQLTEFALGLCLPKGSSTDQTTSSSASNQESKTPTAAISGGIVGVLVIVLAMVIIVRKYKRTSRPRMTNNGANLSGDDMESVGVSPRGDEGEGSYANMSPRENTKMGAA